MTTTTDGLASLYLREIGRVPLLTPPQEIALAKRIKRGCKKSREQMICANLRLVVKIAAELGGRGLPLADLVAEGNVGLVKAVERFEAGRGAKFSTYASWWIKQTMRRALANQCGAVRLPEHLSDKLAKISRISSKLSEQMGREPADGEIAAEVGMSEESVARLRQKAVREVSLDAPIRSGEGPSHARGEILEAVHARTPYEQLSEKNLRQHAVQLLDLLNSRERRVINLRYGLEDGVGRTLEEVSREFGCTRENVRLIQESALRKIRRRMAELERPAGILSDGAFGRRAEVGVSCAG